MANLRNLWVSVFIFILVLSPTGCSSGKTPLDPGPISAYGITDITPDWLSMKPERATVVDNLLLVSNPHELFIFDITNPEDPTYISRVEVENAYKLEFIDGYGYARPIAGKMNIVDIDPPEMAHVAGMVKIPSVFTYSHIPGNNIYILTYDSELMVYEINPPGSVRRTSIGDLNGYMGNITVNGDFLYLTNYKTGLDVFNISDPSSPLYVKTIVNVKSYSQVVIHGDYGYLNDHDRIIVLDISDPGDPLLMVTPALFGKGDLFIDGDLGFIADTHTDQWGLVEIQIVDITDPASLGMVGEMKVKSDTRVSDVSGDFAYAAGKKDGLLIYNIEAPHFPKLAKSIYTLYVPRDISVCDGMVCVADESIGLTVIDATAAVDAEIIDSLFLARDGTVVADGGFAYFIMRTPGSTLGTYDLGNAGSSTILGNLSLQSQVVDMDAKDGYVYLATHSDGLHIVDATDPSTPELMLELPTGEKTVSVLINGDYAYVVDVDEGLIVIDIVDPLSPKVRATLPVTGDYLSYHCRFHLAIKDGFVFVSSNDGKAEVTTGFGSYRDVDVVPYIDVFDLTDPDTPLSLGTWEMDNRVDALAVVGSNLLVGVQDGIEVLDITDPVSPVHLGTYMGVRGVRGIEVAGNIAYTMARDSVRIIYLGNLPG